VRPDAIAAVIFLTALVQAAAKDTWSWGKERFFPPLPEPVKVDGKFVAQIFEPSLCAWIGEDRCYKYEAKDYAYYSHPNNGAKCYREAWSGSQMKREYLMVQPGAARRSIS
jgi:hypothetical protein